MIEIVNRRPLAAQVYLITRAEQAIGGSTAARRPSPTPIGDGPPNGTTRSIENSCVAASPSAGPMEQIREGFFRPEGPILSAQAKGLRL